MENYREKRLERQLKSQQTVAIVIAVILLLSIGGNLFLYLRNNTINREKSELIEQNNLISAERRAAEESNSQLQAEISELNNQVTLIRESAATLEAEIHARDSRISNLRNQVAEIDQLRAQVAELEELKEEFARLEEEREKLLSELQSLGEKLTEIQNKNQVLLERQEEATFLKAYNICVHNLRDRWLGRPVEMELARRVNRTMLSFEINGNIFVETGQKNIHLVITDPNGNILNQSSETFTIAETGMSSNYTEFTTIHYNQQPVPISFTITHDDNLEPGTYSAKVYMDGVFAGAQEFNLE